MPSLLLCLALLGRGAGQSGRAAAREAARHQPLSDPLRLQQLQLDGGVLLGCFWGALGVQCFFGGAVHCNETAARC